MVGRAESLTLRHPPEAVDLPPTSSLSADALSLPVVALAPRV
jgi:hypothetical protein